MGRSFLVCCSSVFVVVISQGVLSNSLLQDRSVSCSSSSMDVFLTFAKEFYGGVFTEEGIGDQRCRWRGHGQRTMVIRFSFVNDSECGLSTNESGGEYSMKLIVSPIDGLLVDGFTTIGVRCIYSTHDVTLTLPPGLNGLSALQINDHEHDDGVITGNGVAPLLSMQILDGHGINGMPLTKASIGQRITLDLVLKNTAIYDFYVYSCTANDGTNNPDANINVVDSNGCAVRLSRAIDIPIFATEPYNHGPKHIFLHMYGFQFTSSQFVHFECRVKPCVRSCHRQQCAADVVKTPLVLALRRRREEAERNGSLDTLRMQTVLQIEAQQTQTAALVSSQEKLDVDKMLPACLLILGVITSLIVLFCLRSSTVKLQMAEDKSI